MITLKKIFKFLFNMKYYLIYWNRFKGLSEKQERYILEKQFKWALGYDLNLDNPKSFNEKIQWLKLYDRNPLMTICADKYKVREYIKEKIGEEYLIPLLGVWDKPEDIDFDSLPNQFVLKVNWGSGQNIIVKDKSKLNVEEAKEKLKNWLKPEANHYYMGLEWSYKNIEPKIICEKYMEQMDGAVNDYKFFCFNGKPMIMYIAVDSYDYSKMSINYYDTEYNLLPFIKHYSNTKQPIPKPVNWDKMLETSKQLSQDFNFVRVDFYDTGDKIYFGELTFYPGNGMDKFEPQEWDYKLGEMIDLSKVPKNLVAVERL